LRGVRSSAAFVAAAVCAGCGGHAQTAQLLAVDTHTGHVAWQRVVKLRRVDSLTAAGTRVLISGTDCKGAGRKDLAFNVATGAPRTVLPNDPVPAPVAALTAGRPEVRAPDGATLSIGASTSGVVVLTRRSSRSNLITWTKQLRQAELSPLPVVRALPGLIVVALAGKPLQLVGLRNRDGRLLWKVPAAHAAGVGPAAIAQGRLLVPIVGSC
jgi:hypothetical protein